MEKTIWNGKLYTATEISNSFELEREIRQASGRKELKCSDPDCPSPILRYCHGEKRCAFFAHLNNCSCDYAIFDKGNTQLMRQVKRSLYDSFILRGFDVQIEVKLLPKHYTHLLFTMPDGKKIAVELGTQRTSANRITYLTEQYKNIDIAVRWIVISNSDMPVKENETFYMKRYLLNKSTKKDVLILNCDGTEITQYIVDSNEYLYKGQPLQLENYPDIYWEKSFLADLVFEDDELSIEGFHFRYNEWLTKKRRAFEKKVAQLEEEARQNEERRKQRQAELEQMSFDATAREGTRRLLCVEKSIPPVNVDAMPTKMSYEDRRQSILPFIDQQAEQVYDKTGVQWIRCELCGAVETASHFWTFGGVNHINLGKCYKCRDGSKNN